jgi:multicomponent Na+:H+ antiporter subunit E
MNAFALNVFLAVVWAASTGQFSLANLAIGFVIGYLVLVLVGPIIGATTYVRRVLSVVGFAGFFIAEIVKANLRLTRDVLTRGGRMRAAIIAYPLKAETDEEIVILANLLSLTPGTLALDVSADRTVLYIHTLYYDDRESFNREISGGFERRVLELLR